MISRVVGEAKPRQVLVRPRAPEPSARHLMEELGDGLTPIGHAKAVLGHVGELTTHHGQPWLNDAYATPRGIMLAANRVLKANGLPQIGGLVSEWRV